MLLLVTKKWFESRPKKLANLLDGRASVFFALLLSFIGGVALLRDTAYQGQDFEVCWKAVHHLLSGEPVYDLIRDGAMVYKYPPWIVTVFLPLGFLSVVTAKWIWGVIELLSLAYVVKWLLRRGYSKRVTASVGFAFWGIWAVHFMDGQISLTILALILWAFDRRQLTVGIWALSSKVFSGFSLLGFPGFLKVSPKQLLLIGLVLCGLSAPAVFVAPGHSPVSLFHSWSVAASSGGLLFDGEKVRGRDNQGMPAMILRTLGIKAANTNADLLFFFICALGLGAYWGLRSKALNEDERWLGWIALSTVVHPLAWFHYFVLAFPLAVVSIDAAMKTKNRRMIITGLIALAMVALVTRKTLGYTGERMELYSIKSWGVLLFLDLIVMLRRLEKAKFSGLRVVSRV